MKAKNYYMWYLYNPQRKPSKFSRVELWFRIAKGKNVWYLV